MPNSSSGGEIFFKTLRREPAEGGMGTQGVVESSDVGKHVGLCHGASGVVREVLVDGAASGSTFGSNMTLIGYWCTAGKVCPFAMAQSGVFEKYDFPTGRKR